jgi:hypothetical protein
VPLTPLVSRDGAQGLVEAAQRLNTRSAVQLSLTSRQQQQHEEQQYEEQQGECGMGSCRYAVCDVPRLRHQGRSTATNLHSCWMPLRKFGLSTAHNRMTLHEAPQLHSNPLLHFPCGRAVIKLQARTM